MREGEDAPPPERPLLLVELLPTIESPSLRVRNGRAGLGSVKTRRVSPEYPSWGVPLVLSHHA